MRLRQLFEAAPAKKVIAVMPGGFHPFHPGHKSLYDWAVETFGKENVYVAATNDTKSRPFPFDVKQKLAAMAGVPTQRFIQVKSPFNALAYESIIGDATQTALVFVRSEKDKSSHPLPDQIRKSDGNMGYLISYKGNGDLETADTHGYMAYGPTIDFDFSGMSIKSASELRAAWPEMSEEDKLKAANLMYPGSGETASKLLDTALGVNETVAAESFSPVQWLKNTFSSDPQFKAWHRVYKQDPNRAAQMFRTKHREFLTALKQAGQAESTVNELFGLFGDGDPIPAPEWLNDENRALWQEKQPTTKNKRFVTQLRAMQRLADNFMSDMANQQLKTEFEEFMDEEAPPGREDQVKALKKEFPDDEGAPYAIAWAQHNKNKKKKTDESDQTNITIDPAKLKRIENVLKRQGLHAARQVATRSMRMTPQEFGAYLKHIQKHGLSESDLVLDRSSLIDYIRDKIVDYVNSEEDLDKLANLLKSLVGKTVSTRGKRFTVSDFDVESVIEACKNSKKKRRG